MNPLASSHVIASADRAALFPGKRLLRSFSYVLFLKQGFTSMPGQRAVADCRRVLSAGEVSFGLRE